MNLFLGNLIDTYFLIVVVSVLLSWVQLPPTNPLVRTLNMLTEPALKPIRQILPPSGGIDFSPLLLLVLLRIIRSAV